MAKKTEGLENVSVIFMPSMKYLFLYSRFSPLLPVLLPCIMNGALSQEQSYLDYCPSVQANEMSISWIIRTVSVLMYRTLQMYKIRFLPCRTTQS